MTLRTKLLAIVGTAGLAFLIVLVSSALLERRIERELTDIRDRYVPRIELGPKLQHGFERLGRAIQDATAAQDREALAATAQIKAELLATLAAAAPTMAPADATELRRAFEDYYGTAADVARRLIQDESGEALLEAMAVMQAKQVHASQLLGRATALEEGELSGAFEAASRAQLYAVQLRFGVMVVCMVMVIALALTLGRSVLRSISDLEAGLQRFGRGDFSEPIAVTTRDELAALAEQANRMAASLRQLSDERDRADWLKEGHVGLSRELRGALEPREVAEKAIGFVARYVDAPIGVFYGVEDGGALAARAHCGADAESLGALRFARGQGLVGRVASQHELSVVTDLPASYLRVKTGLGEGRAEAVVLLPLVHLGRTIGVLELAVLKPWTPLKSELLRSVQETIAIALDVAEARSALRELLAETQSQAEQLAAQEEELRATNEELRSQQGELQAQQEELRQANDELLEQQRVLEQKNAELAEARMRLEQKAEELASVSAYKSQFLANMSHELRTPLNSMLLLSNLLAQNETKNLTERQVDFCKTIHGAGKDLLQLINQVLDLAKIESGKQQASFEPVPLRELADRAERIFAPLARDKGLSFTVELASGLPDSITTDKHRIDQILNNLIGNAIKFTERGSVSLRIAPADPHAKLQDGGIDLAHAIAFAVRDTGIGIAPEHHETVFAPFEQVDGSADRRYGGTGLGLAIGRELAGLLGGELQLESTPHVGSTFTCYLPLSPPAASPREVTARERRHNGAKPVVPDDRAALASGDPHLLVVEDDPVFADLVGEVIHGQGLKYVVANSGGLALELARTSKPTGVILDVGLPDVDGFQVMQALRADALTADIPVHFISALESGERGMALGAVGYLTKPATRNDIVRAVQSIVPKPRDDAYRVLIVEDDAAISDLLAQRLGDEEIQVERTSSAKEALELLQRRPIHCMVLDLSLPDMTGLELLRKLHEQRSSNSPPVIVYTGRPLSKAEAQSLEAYTEAIVLKEGPSADRVLDEIRLFARRLKAGLPAARRTAAPPPTPLRLEGKTLLLADDDMRTVYALSAILRAKGADVLMADTGKVALELLAAHPEVDAVLMDIMMPEMDGYEAIRRIRQEAHWQRLPIIALTAKAMKGDRERCLAAGATDYLPKPIDPDALSAMLQTRLKEAPAHGA